MTQRAFGPPTPRLTSFTSITSIALALTTASCLGTVSSSSSGGGGGAPDQGEGGAAPDSSVGPCTNAVSVGAGTPTACANPLTTCGPSCADLSSNEHHCGACDVLCTFGADCVAGACAPCAAICPPPAPSPTSVTCSISAAAEIDPQGNWPTIAWTGSSYGVCYERSSAAMTGFDLHFAVLDTAGVPLIGPSPIPVEQPTQGCDVAWNAGVFALVAADGVVRILDASGALVTTTSITPGYYPRIAAYKDGFVVIDTTGSPPDGTIQATYIAPDGSKGGSWPIGSTAVFGDTAAAAVSPCGIAYGGRYPFAGAFASAVGIRPSCEEPVTTDGLSGHLSPLVWAGDRYVGFSDDLVRFGTDGSFLGSTPLASAMQRVSAAAYTGSHLLAVVSSPEADPTVQHSVVALDLDGAPISAPLVVGTGWNGFAPDMLHHDGGATVVWGPNFVRVDCTE